MNWLFMSSSQRGDWTWLMEFYQRVIDQKWQRKKKSKEHWYQKAILSKFLYYNINGDGATEPVPESDNPDEACGAEEFGSSWPVTFISTASYSEEAAAHRGKCSHEQQVCIGTRGFQRAEPYHIVQQRGEQSGFEE